MNEHIRGLVGLLNQAGKRPSHSTRAIHTLLDAVESGRTSAAIKEAADEINAAWRNRTPEQIAEHELYRLEQIARGISDDQFDAEREAEQQGITTRRYLRGL